MSGLRLATLTTLTASMLVGPNTGAGAQPASPAPPTPCPRATNTCPPPSVSGGQLIKVNVVPVADGTTCEFELDQAPDVETVVGLNAYWYFCSRCPVDTLIQLATKPPDRPKRPFDNFQAFIPQPDAGNVVEVPTACNDDSDAEGRQARTVMTSEYDLYLRPANGVGEWDHIDPRLEIDDNYAPLLPPRRALLMPGLLVLFAGLLAGALAMRWYLARSARR